MSRTLIRSTALVVVLVALGYYESRLRPAARARELPTGAAEWIWAADVGPEDGWVNFFLYRDFEVPGTVPDRAALVLRADGGYWAFVNGQPVGSGAFRERSPMDSYDVARFLRPGANRLLIQVRSRRGVGGLIARLSLGPSGDVVTDRNWNMCRRYESAVLGSGFVPEDVGGVQSWGPPPVGAWPVPPGVDAAPLLADQLVPLQSARVARFRALGQSDWERRVPAPEERNRLGRWVSFDLGRVVQGYVNVVFADSAGGSGLVYLGRERASGPDTAEPATYFLSPPGRGSWSDLQPREFRFVTVLALEDISGLRVFETEPGFAGARGSGEIRPRRAFAFAPPPSAATVEDEFWRELKRVTGLTGREAFESVLGG